jgi:DHA1 family multidrug resistance protein-like MFS transporter
MTKTLLLKQPQWRKNQIAVTVSGAFLSFGYTLVIPFLPIFVRQLGVESTGGIAFWSGLLIATSPIIASLAGPLWGRIGDRRGMKALATRTTAANTIFWFMMGFSRNVWQLLAWRAVLGLTGGFNIVSVALITQSSPREKVPSIIGTLQSVQILSAAVGPFLGGILASTIGIRNTFFVVGIINLGGFLTMMLLYSDEKTAKTREAEIEGSTSPSKLASFWRRPEYLTSLLILFFINMADRTFGPIIPLFLEELGTPRGRLELVAGTLISIAAFGEAFSAWLSGKLASRVPLRRLITVRLVLSILVLVPMVFVHTTQQFSILRVFLALLAGGTITLALSTAHHVIPSEHHGAGFALLQSTSMFGTAIGPLIAGSMAAFSIRSIFVFNSVVYLLMIIFVHRNVRH